ncbi:MAG: dihydroorotate dehydrogenase electron transfer subunit [Bacteroidaceae bacterium]|nr:dihydroorotate dehydrogenase electron transfer subunit [Bacteroidaceae bacterium]
MKKEIIDLRIVSVERLHERYVLLRATNPAGPLPEMRPGQFAQLRADLAPNTFLRRPISINFVDVTANEVWFLIQTVGEGSRSFARLQTGDMLNAVLPLGNGFTLPATSAERVLLVGGGVGTAPLLYMGSQMLAMGCRPTFLLGARSKGDLLQMEAFQRLGDVFVTTEDGTAGERGFVTQHSVLRERQFDRISTCGPKPMMVAVARFAKSAGIACEVSLENMMACGVGACLCCVEDTQEGHVCVCKEGPVFNMEDLKWQI